MVRPANTVISAPPCGMQNADLPSLPPGTDGARSSLGTHDSTITFSTSLVDCQTGAFLRKSIPCLRWVVSVLLSCQTDTQAIYSEKIRGFCHRKRQIPGLLSARYSKIAQRVFLLFSDFQILIFDFFGSFNLLKI